MSQNFRSIHYITNITSNNNSYDIHSSWPRRDEMKLGKHLVAYDNDFSF